MQQWESPEQENCASSRLINTPIAIEFPPTGGVYEQAAKMLSPFVRKNLCSFRRK